MKKKISPEKSYIILYVKIQWSRIAYYIVFKEFARTYTH